MKKIITVASNDWHLEESSLAIIRGIITNLFQKCLELEAKEIIILGDIFDERSSIPEPVLNGFGSILEEANRLGITIICFPGNHDKIDYRKNESYLTPFVHHPNFVLIEDITEITLNDQKFCIVPFFTDDIIVEKLNKFSENRKDLKDIILLSHTSVIGSVNNNGEKVSKGVNTNVFSKFKKVFLGHYHNTHEVTSKIIHLPSIRQKNFGEDELKGFTIIYEDADYSIIPLGTKKFVNIDVDLDKVSVSALHDLIESLPEDQHSKLRIIGTESKIKSIDLNILNQKGVKFSTKSKELIVDDSVINMDSSIMNSKDLVSEMKKFLESKNYTDKSLTYLKKHLKYEG